MTDNFRSSADNRDPKGRFAVGNPGRTPGSRNKVSMQALAKIRSLTDDAFEALAENVRARDQRAVEYVLDRIVPKGRLIELEAANSDAVAEALIGGELTADEGKRIASALAALKQMEDLDLIKQRMLEIERLLKGE